MLGNICVRGSINSDLSCGAARSTQKQRTEGKGNGGSTETEDRRFGGRDWGGCNAKAVDMRLEGRWQHHGDGREVREGDE